METDLFVARVKDTASISINTNKPKFFGFLSPEQALKANEILSNIKINSELFGGYDNASRVFLGCFPEWDITHSFPIQSLTFRYNNKYKLLHRDFLGSLIASGIKRESIGDILVGDGYTVIFVTNDITNYVIQQITKVGNIGVKIILGYNDPLPDGDKLIDYSSTISSLRLDCVCSALTGLSRSVSLEIISDGMVSVNSVVCEKAVKSISQGDIIRIRGYGKYIISDSDKTTKKGRIILNFKKYN